MISGRSPLRDAIQHPLRMSFPSSRAEMLKERGHAEHLSLKFLDKSPSRTQRSLPLKFDSTREPVLKLTEVQRFLSPPNMSCTDRPINAVRKQFKSLSMPFGKKSQNEHCGELSRYNIDDDYYYTCLKAKLADVKKFAKDYEFDTSGTKQEICDRLDVVTRPTSRPRRVM
jgi:hypothetical protein